MVEESHGREIGQLVSLADAFRELGLTVHTGRAWVLQRKIAHCKIGRRVMIPRSEIERLKQAGFVPALG